MSLPPLLYSFLLSSGDDLLQVGVAAVLDMANHFQFDPLESSSSDIAASDSEDEPQDPHIGHIQWSVQRVKLIVREICEHNKNCCLMLQLQRHRKRPTTTNN